MSFGSPVPIGQNITEAVQALRQGKLLGFPTETVYGLGADALNASAVSAVFKAKGRPFDHPLIVHVASADELDNWAIDIPPIARLLAQTFWPGPLTLVLKKHPRVPMVVTGGQETVALRMPNHPLTLRLLDRFGGGIVGPSANRYQRVSPTSAQDVLEELGGQLAYILDGGACTVGIESTIVRCDSEAKLQILRQGAIGPSSLQSIQSSASTLILAKASSGTKTPKVPGSDAVHYAPIKPVFMATYPELQERLLAVMTSNPDQLISVLSFSSKPNAFSAWQALDWQVIPRDHVVYQQQLYARLRAFDSASATQLWIERVPDDKEEWLPVCDRLQRVTAKHHIASLYYKK